MQSKMIYVVKVKFATNPDAMYSNRDYMLEINRIDRKQTFFLSLDAAKELKKNLLMRAKDPSNAEGFEYIALVELSNYAPYPEHNVIDYVEIK